MIQLYKICSDVVYTVRKITLPEKMTWKNFEQKLWRWDLKFFPQKPERS